MENACFRCKTPIDSGLTFCRDCRERVGQDDGADAATEGEATFEASSSGDDGPGRNLSLLGVALAPAVWLGVVVLTALPFAFAGTDTATVLLVTGLSLTTPFLLPVFAYALLKDAEYVRGRGDVDWSPSELGYWGLVGTLVLTLGATMPVVGAYHLYRRHASTGLSWTRDEAA